MKSDRCYKKKRELPPSMPPREEETIPREKERNGKRMMSNKKLKNLRNERIVFLLT